VTRAQRGAVLLTAAALAGCSDRRLVPPGGWLLPVASGRIEVVSDTDVLAGAARAETPAPAR